MRVEEFASRAGVSVDTVRYYQAKGLLPPPRREGRVAWYGGGHLDRIARIRSLQARGFTLATIVRVVNGELDAADEALVEELSGTHEARSGAVRADDGRDGGDEGDGGDGPDGPRGTAGGGGPDEELLTLEELAVRTGVPLPLLRAVESEGLLVPRRVGSTDRYTAEDVDAARAGLVILEWGVPLSDLLDLARRHHAATEEVARQAVELFAVHVRGPRRNRAGSTVTVGTTAGGDGPDGTEDVDGVDGVEGVDGLVEAYNALLPAVTTLVGHHFTRTLLRTALEHIEQVGTDTELRAVHGVDVPAVAG